MQPCHHVLRGDDRGPAADAARGVHPEHRLARRGQRIGQPELGHHHAFEHVGRLADDDRVDVGHREVGVGERPVDGLANETGDRHVGATRGVIRLADADAPHSARPSVALHARRRGAAAGTARLAWPSARSAVPSMTRLGGLGEPGEPGRHQWVRAQRAAARVDRRSVGVDAERRREQQLLVGERRMELGDVEPITTGARLGTGQPRRRQVGQRAQAERLVSMRWSIARIHAGRSHSDAGDVARRDHHGRDTVGHRRAVVLAQRVGDRRRWRAGRSPCTRPA